MTYFVVPERGLCCCRPEEREDQHERGQCDEVGSRSRRPQAERAANACHAAGNRGEGGERQHDREGGERTERCQQRESGGDRQ